MTRQQMLAQALREQLETEAAAAGANRVAAALRLGHLHALLAAIERSMEEVQDPDIQLAALDDAATRFTEYQRLDAAAVQWCSAIRFSPLSYRPWWGLADVLRAVGRTDVAGICHLNAARCALCWALHKRRSPGETPGRPQLLGLMLSHSAVNYRRADCSEPLKEQTLGGIAAIEHLRSFPDGEWRKALSDLSLPLNIRGMRLAGLSVQIEVEGGSESLFPVLPAKIESELDRLAPFYHAIMASSTGPDLDESELGFDSKSFDVLDRMFARKG